MLTENNAIDTFIKNHKLESIEIDLYDALYNSNWEDPETALDVQKKLSEQKDEIKQLTSLLNTPETEKFIDGLRNEAGHQRWRWGDEHDIRKTAADWFWTLGFLSQKAMTAIESGDIKKAKHHTISSAALLANWHRQISRDGLE